MAQLAKRSLALPEIRGSYPVIGKKIIINIFTVNCRKDKINKKRSGMAYSYIKLGRFRKSLQSQLNN